MNAKTVFLLIIVGVVLVCGCTGGGTSPGTNTTGQQTGGGGGGGTGGTGGGQAGGGAGGTGGSDGGAGLGCTSPQGALPIGQEYYTCTSNQKGFGVTLEGVKAGVFCNHSDFPNYQAKVATRIELTGKGYYDYYAFYPEWDGIITDNLGNKYYPYLGCRDDQINPEAKNHAWVKIGDAAYAPCVNNCELHGGVYFQLLDSNATEFSLEVFGFNYTFTKDEVEWLNNADKGYIAAQFEGCKEVARDCPGEYCSTACSIACADKDDKDIMDGTNFDVSGEMTSICSGENNTSACYHCMNGYADDIAQP